MGLKDSKLMTLNIYNEDNEVEKTLKRGFIPWKIMKRAVRLMRANNGMSDGGMTEEAIDEITRLVMDVFDGKVTVEELENGATAEEMITLIHDVVKKLEVKSNPT